MDTILDLALLFSLAVLGVALFRPLRLPSIVGFLAAGVVAGPYALRLIGDPLQVDALADMGMVLLLFSLGIEFSPAEMGSVRRIALWGGAGQVLGTTLITFLISLLAGEPLPRALFYGFLLSLSSTAIVMKVLLDRGKLDTSTGKASLGILLFQDLCVIPLMLLVPLLGGASGGGAAGMGWTVLRAAVVGAAVFLGVRTLVPWFLRTALGSRNRELLLLTTAAALFASAWATSAAGLSPALGAFLAGMALAESEPSRQILGSITPFRDVFLSLFFISMGMLLDPAYLLRHLPLVLALAAAVILLKALTATGAALAIGIPAHLAVTTGLALSQVGEFSLVLAREGTTYRLFDPSAFQLFLGASMATMALTPAVMGASSRVAGWACGLLPRPLVAGHPALVRESGRRAHPRKADHVIIAGFGLNGHNLAKVLRRFQIPYTVVEANPFLAREEKEKHEPIVFGDAATPEVLEHAGVKEARILVVAISDRGATRKVVTQALALSPRLHVIVRTRLMAEVEPLLRRGAAEVIPEEFETSVEILARVLRKYLYPQDAIEQAVAEVRQGGYEVLRGHSRRHAHATGIGGYLSGLEIAAFRVRPGTELDGRSIREAGLRARAGVTVLAVRRGGDVFANPDPGMVLAGEDVALLLGTTEQLSAARRVLEEPSA